MGTVLFETRVGCLDDPMPQDAQDFINNVAEMLTTMVPSMVMYEKQKKWGSKYVKRHFAAWDGIFEFAGKVVDRYVCMCILF